MRSLEEFSDAHLRIFHRPPPKPDTHDIYLIGIGGTGMGALAGLLTEAGYAVRGSDRGIYPPMSTFLHDLGISVYDGYAESNLSTHPDLVITGNACVPTHLEATVVREKKIPQLSFPEAIHHFFLQNRRSIVVAGTHGKTTTSGMLVHVFRSSGREPGYLVGGILQDFERSFSIGSDPQFIIEGDEYDSAYFDKRPKFIHYAPKVAVITSVEFDHADIYTCYEEYKEAFETFANLIPEDGLLAICGDDPGVTQLHTHSAPVLTYGLDSQHDVVGQILESNETGIRFELIYHGEDLGEVMLPLHGDHNLRNALAVCTIALHEGLTFEEIAIGLASFSGMKRRQEILGEPDGILIIDDFAHHPTAVRATIQAAEQRWPHRRLIAVFEPGTNSSRRKIFEDSYGQAFGGASMAYLCSPPFRHNDTLEQFLDIQVVMDRIRDDGTDVKCFENTSSLLEDLTREVKTEDVVLIMSNGSFNGLHQNLLHALHSR